MSTRGSDGSETGVPAALGAVAFLVGYGITYLAGRGTVESAMEEDGFLTLSAGGSSTDMVASDFQGGQISPPETYNVVGWGFFDLHGADTNGQMTISGTGASESFDLSLAFSLDSWLMVVPPVAIAACGYLAARRIGPRTPREAVVAGAKVTVGYLVLVGVAALAFQWGQAGVESGGFAYAQYTIRFGPALSPSLLVAGVGYPAVFGAAGGYAAYEQASRSGAGGGPAARGGQHPPARGGRSTRRGRNAGQGGRNTRGRNAQGQNGGRAGQQPRQGQPNRRRSGQRQRSGRRGSRDGNANRDRRDGNADRDGRDGRTRRDQDDRQRRGERGPRRDGRDDRRREGGDRRDDRSPDRDERGN